MDSPIAARAEIQPHQSPTWRPRPGSGWHSPQGRVNPPHPGHQTRSARAAAPAAGDPTPGADNTTMPGHHRTHGSGERPAGAGRHPHAEDRRGRFSRPRRDTAHKREALVRMCVFSRSPLGGDRLTSLADRVQTRDFDATSMRFSRGIGCTCCKHPSRARLRCDFRGPRKKQTCDFDATYAGHRLHMLQTRDFRGPFAAHAANANFHGRS